MTTDVVGLRFVAEGEKDATNALKRFSAAQDKLKTSVMDAASRVQRTASLWERANQLNKDGVLSTNALTAAQTQAARQLAVLNGYLTKSGAINTQYAKKVLRAEQATRDAAKAAKDKALQDRLAAQAAEQAARAVARRDAEDRKAFQQYLRYQREKTQAAARAAREIEQAAEREARAQRQAAQETARLAAETEALARAYNPVMAATSVYEREVQQLNRAHQLGVLSADALEAKLGELQASYAQVGAGTMQAQNFINQFGSVTQIAGVKTNRFGMVAQQVGYQVGDFFVQIQSGTNAFVAFGQQATQLAGLLPGLAGAVVGISISVGTMLLAAWDRARKAQDEAAASVKNLQSELESLDRTLQDWIRTKKASSMGISVEELIGTEGLDKAIADLETARQSLVPGQAEVLRSLESRGFAGLQEAENMFAYRNDAVEAYLVALRRVFDLERRLNSENIAALEEQVSAEMRALELKRVEQQYGSDSIQLLRAQNSLELESLETKLRQEAAAGGVTEAEERLIQAILSAVRQQHKMSEAIHESESATGGLANGLDHVGARARAAAQGVMGILAALRSTMAELRTQEAGIAAAQRAANRGMSESQVRSVQAQVTTGVAMEAQLAAEGITGPEALAIIAQAQEAERRRLQNQETETSIYDSFNVRGGGGGGGGGAPREQEDYLKNLLLEAQHKQRLVGLTEEQTRRQELLFDLEKRKLPIDEERIEQIIRVEAETRKLLEAEARREQLMQSVESNITSAFMSIVDGSASVEDAFRNMMRNILLAVYEQMVAQPAAAGISNLLSGVFGGLTGGLRTQANGGGWNNGVQFFANGGVVNAPTMFGHSSGLGVMGEAGPEAVMPLKRGADGKLGVSAGGGGSLTVNVVMDPSTGALGAFVQDQAGQVVAKAAPQLAQHAAKSMVDQRRRGGSMKAVFRG